MIGTSDGKTYESEFHFALDRPMEMAMEAPKNKFQGGGRGEGGAGGGTPPKDLPGPKDSLPMKRDEFQPGGRDVMTPQQIDKFNQQRPKDTETLEQFKQRIQKQKDEIDELYQRYFPNSPAASVEAPSTLLANIEEPKRPPPILPNVGPVPSIAPHNPNPPGGGPYTIKPGEKLGFMPTVREKAGDWPIGQAGADLTPFKSVKQEMQDQTDKAYWNQIMPNQQFMDWADKHINKENWEKFIKEAPKSWNIEDRTSFPKMFGYVLRQMFTNPQKLFEDFNRDLKAKLKE